MNNRSGSLFVRKILSINVFSDIIQNECLNEKDVGEIIAKKTNCEL